MTSTSESRTLSQVPVPLAEATTANAVGVAVMWLLEFVDSLIGNRLDLFGIRSWDVGSLWTILTAPMLHLGWSHLLSNTVPLLILGVLTALGGIRRWLVVVALSMLGSGLLAWFINAPGTLTLGASGVVFGLLTYVLARGFYSRNAWQILLAVVVFGLYGGVLWGVLPTQSGVSWQGHLGGAIGGLLAAWLLHRNRHHEPALSNRR